MDVDKEKETKKEEPGIDIDGLASTIATKITLPDNLTGVINEMVEKAFKDKGLDEVVRKAKLFEGQPDPEELTKEQLRDAFITGILKAWNPRAKFTDAQTKALSETTDTAGGYLVPEFYRAEIIQRLPELSELYPYVRKIPVNLDSGYLPSLATDVSMTWGTSENTALTETDAVLGQVTFNTNKVSAICYMSRELASDSNPGIVEYVTQLFTEAIAAERDRVIAIGTNSSQPEGIFSASGISATSGVSGALTYDKVVTLKFALARKYHAKARWVMNETTMGYMHKIKDDNSMPILKDALVSSDMPRLLGLPYGTQHQIGDGYVALGDMSRYLWFDRQAMVIETTTEGGDTFAKHQIGLKVVERVDGGVGLAAAFVKSGALTAPA